MGGHSQALCLACSLPGSAHPQTSSCCRSQTVVFSFHLCRGPAPADPGYSKRGRRRRPIYIYLFIKDSKSNRMRIAQ